MAVHYENGADGGLARLPAVDVLHDAVDVYVLSRPLYLQRGQGHHYVESTTGETLSLLAGGGQGDQHVSILPRVFVK